MGAGSSSRSPEQPGAEHLCKKLAFQLQADLDEYITNNPDFPVSSSVSSRLMQAEPRCHRRRKVGREPYYSSLTDLWIRLLRLHMNFGIKPW